VKGKGVPNLQRRGRGDLFVTVHVVTPTDLSKEETKLLRQLATLRGEGKAADAPLRRPGY
jgi:molecular chaperone DnaJ